MSDSVAPSRPDGNPSGGGTDFSRYLPQRSFGLKLILVCVLALMMAVPAGLVWALIYARSSDASAAISEVAQLRGGAQTLMGPALVVPYDYPTMLDGRMQRVTGHAVLYAETGTATMTLDSEKLRRGLHDVPVYTADTSFTARFEPSRLAANIPADGELRWPEARMYLSLTDLRGAKEATLTVAGRNAELAPAEAAVSTPGSAQITFQRLVGSPVPWIADNLASAVEVSARLRTTGAQRVALAAFAKDTTIYMKSDWPAPSFDGGALPDERTVTEQGFTASWRIPFLARGAAGGGANLSFDTLINTSPGATLLDLGNPYQSVERALKYAPMFLGLVFLTYFLFEATSGARAHPAQYVLVGLAQCVFYMLLLSISEQLGFNLGFLVAATATVLALSLYAGSVFGSRGAAIKAFSVFFALYGLIYVLMRMEDYALLVGSIASFAAIAATMWMTRKLDWYGVGRGRDLSGQNTPSALI